MLTTPCCFSVLHGHSYLLCPSIQVLFKTFPATWDKQAQGNGCVGSLHCLPPQSQVAVRWSEVTCLIRRTITWYEGHHRDCNYKGMGDLIFRCVVTVGYVVTSKLFGDSWLRKKKTLDDSWEKYIVHGICWHWYRTEFGGVNFKVLQQKASLAVFSGCPPALCSAGRSRHSAVLRSTAQ